MSDNIRRIKAGEEIYNLDAKFWGGFSINDIKSVNGQPVICGDSDGDYDIITVQPIIKTTYNDLVSLRDNNELIPGQQYRITDYVTTTTQKNTMSAGHQFDIIVTALDESTLSEEAKAIQTDKDHDDYFDSCNLSAWKIWYSLENDVNRFKWADSENGNGVIYRMIDEWCNDCPYDFKNIKFKRGLYIDGGGIATKDGEEDFFAYCYTFSWWDNNQSVIMDTSIFGNNGSLLNNEGQISGVYGNIIGVYNSYDGLDESPQSTKQYLNDIVFFSTSTYGYGGRMYYGCYSNTFGNDCYSNNFGNECHSNNFGNDCYSNTFGNKCYSNNFGNDCYSNTFGNKCYSNNFGNECYSNTFDNNCYLNTFCNRCLFNTFGDSCHSNTFGDNCRANNFGNECSDNTLGYNCSYNTFDNMCLYNTFGICCDSNTFGDKCFSNDFGAVCSKNTFGNYCSSNTFGDNCSSNTFSNECKSNTFGNIFQSNTFGNECCENVLPSYCLNNTFDDLCFKIKVIKDNETGNMQKYNIKKGVSEKTINVEFINSEIGIDVWVTSSGELIQEPINEYISLGDIDLMWGEFFYSEGAYYSGTSQNSEEIINSIGIGDYDEEKEGSDEE